MTDWLSVMFSAVWIAGLAGILATLSYYRWLVQTSGTRLATVLADRRRQQPLWAGMLLVSMGFADVLAKDPWQRVACLVVAAFCGWQCVRGLRERRGRDRLCDDDMMHVRR